MNMQKLVDELAAGNWVFHNYIHNGNWIAFNNITQAENLVQDESCWFIFIRGPQMGTVYFENGKYVRAEMVGAWEQLVKNSIFERTVEKWAKGE